MGIFSKIKNYITGGAAEVAIVYEQPVTDGSRSIKLFVTATAKDDCKIKKVYLNIRGRETYVKSVRHTEMDSEGRSVDRYSDEVRDENHFYKELILAEDISLSKGQSEKWLAEFELPNNAKATYHGKQVFFKWETYAGLDMPGNDPDSGWVEFILAKNMSYTINDIG